MVCSQCNCSGHYKTTCQFLNTVSPAEQRVAAELGAMLPVVKAKKVNKPLEGLAGCANIFKEPKVVKPKKHLKTCSGCGEKGHNTRTCANICPPCSPSKTLKSTRNDSATIVQKYARRMIVINRRNATEFSVAMTALGF
jgi:hypothetical protein